MNFKKNVGIVLSLYVFFVFLFFALVYKQKAHKPYLSIVCTTSIVGDTVQQIVGDLFVVQNLMGPGVDPHLYKPVENDIMKIAQADIIFYSGLHLEAQMEHIFKQLERSKITVAITKNIPRENLIASFEYENNYDPHVWFDPLLWIQTIEIIEQTLSLQDPQNSLVYKKNAEKYINDCKLVFTETKKILDQIPKERRILITGHDAFQYFAQAYDFEVVGLQGISTESQVGSQDIQELIDTIVEKQIPAIFIETSTPIRNIRALQEGVAQRGYRVEIGGELFSDALGSLGTEAATYLGMIKTNIHTIFQALTKK
jgi:manganese/zinc/iron transport system substrate-binding protein